MKFIDEAKISVASGDGGKGAVSFRREKFVPRGGPDGGQGGRGASVVFASERNMASLLDFRYKRIYKADHGGHGMGKDKSGKDGEDLVISVPVGTVISEFDTGEILFDFTEDGERFTCASGGRGGKGNAHFKSSTNQAPKYAQPGEPGAELTLKLELKLLADVGIIGFPNAGKSTFISRVSAAKPRIADYPFTTLAPNLGVVQYGKFGSFVIADIPGLVKGAHSGKGLGTRFLKHVERTSLFIHMIDLSPETGREPDEDFETINLELEAFNPELSTRLQVVALNKTDIADPDERASGLLNLLSDKGIKVFSISAVTGDGIDRLINFVGAEVEKIRNDGFAEKDDDRGQEGSSKAW